MDLKIGGFKFKTFAADHPPRHVHIFYEGRELGKFDIENQKSMNKRLKITGKLRKALKKAGYMK
jgi:hypothetical protein